MPAAPHPPSPPARPAPRRGTLGIEKRPLPKWGEGKAGAA